jgi:hypothetical protein
VRGYNLLTWINFTAAELEMAWRKAQKLLAAPWDEVGKSQTAAMASFLLDKKPLQSQATILKFCGFRLGKAIDFTQFGGVARTLDGCHIRH